MLILVQNKLKRNFHLSVQPHLKIEWRHYIIIIPLGKELSHKVPILTNHFLSNFC